MPTAIDSRRKTEAAVQRFGKQPLRQAALEFLDDLGYRSQLELKISGVDAFRSELDQDGRLNPEHAHLDEWKNVEFLRQVTGRDLSPTGELFRHDYDPSEIQSYVFLAIDLKDERYTRNKLSQISRAVNRIFMMPALLIFKHGESLTFSVVNRRLNKRDQSRDVLEKVTLIKDISTDEPLRAHTEILTDLSLEPLRQETGFRDFEGLHAAWTKKLSSYALNERFYREISDWYFWSRHLVEEGAIKLPSHCDTEQEKSLFLIRLLTRLIFCWFLVEKKLLPSSLFRPNRLQQLLKDLSDESSTYYHAVLQNLFFGTLNMPPGQRGFREKKKEGERYDKNYGVTNLWRYEKDFRDPAKWVEICRHIPFLNGGLFDCLDDKSGKKQDNFILDGFSDRAEFGCHLPNELFFGGERAVDLSKDYGEENKRTARSKRAKVSGLIEILSRYKFTIEENTPLEEEIALDPELLGKVFENLLASYNEDTKTTARKALGAFYTPREIVSYMVDESLKSYLATKVPRCKGALEDLFSNKATLKEIKPDTREALIRAIGQVKILDPACGSGAFPMGALHRLVDLLQKLDPNNESWKRDRLAEARRYREILAESGAAKEEIDACDARIADIEKSFDTRFHALDYARKLFLIENCIFGVDIQPIATQIAKLRFFISLVVDQKTDANADNLGVRPLPNLETRIVAADSLIPIEKADSDLLTGELDKLRSELISIRHEHFSARNPTAKRKWREADETKRGEIATLLERNHALPKDSAKKLAAWDPYDQNNFAPFFDSEWMFGLPIGKVRLDGKPPATLLGNLALINDASGQSELVASEPREYDSGFDIVIGNPPYGVKFPSILKQRLSAYYPQASKVPDSYAFFMLRGLALLRPSGALTYIVPNTFCDLENADTFRMHMLKNVAIHSIWQSGWVFSAAVVDTLVLILEASEPQPNHEIVVVTEESKNQKSQARFLKAPLAKIDFRTSDIVGELKDRVRRNTKSLSVDFYVKAGVKMYEKGKGSPPQSEAVVTTKPFSRTGQSPKGWRVLYRGGDVAPFRLTDSGERVKYGPWLAAPRSPELFESPKILMRRTDDRLRSSLDMSDAICVNSCHVIKLRAPGINALERYIEILAVLNSRVCQWVFEADNPQMVGKTFAEIKVVYVERLPLPSISDAQSRLIRPLVEILLLLHSALEESEQSTRDPLMLAYWDQVLNSLVYELYFPNEIHDAGLHLFDLVQEANLPEVNKILEKDRLPMLRKKFEELHDGTHPLRIALDKLQTLDTIRIIEGRA